MSDWRRALAFLGVSVLAHLILLALLPLFAAGDGELPGPLEGPLKESSRLTKEPRNSAFLWLIETEASAAAGREAVSPARPPAPPVAEYRVDRSVARVPVEIPRGGLTVSPEVRARDPEPASDLRPAEDSPAVFDAVLGGELLAPELPRENPETVPDIVQPEPTPVAPVGVAVRELSAEPEAPVPPWSSSQPDELPATEDEPRPLPLLESAPVQPVAEAPEPSRQVARSQQLKEWREPAGGAFPVLDPAAAPNGNGMAQASTPFNGSEDGTPVDHGHSGASEVNPPSQESAPLMDQVALSRGLSHGILGGAYPSRAPANSSKGSERPEESQEPQEPAEAETVEVPAFVPPRVKVKVAPTYPSRARRQGAEGRVLLQVDVDENGLSIGARILESSGRKDLDAAALEAVRRWQFYPAQEGDRPVRGHVEVTVVFQLK